MKEILIVRPPKSDWAKKRRCARRRLTAGLKNLSRAGLGSGYMKTRSEIHTKIAYELRAQAGRACQAPGAGANGIDVGQFQVMKRAAAETEVALRVDRLAHFLLFHGDLNVQDCGHENHLGHFGAKKSKIVYHVLSPTRVGRSSPCLATAFVGMDLGLGNLKSLSKTHVPMEMRRYLL